MLKICLVLVFFIFFPFLLAYAETSENSITFPENYRSIDTEHKLEPTALTVDEDYVYVIDYVYDEFEGFRPGIGTQSYITIYDLDGEFVRKFNHEESKAYLSYPQDIAVNNGIIYVANTGGNDVKVFYNDGNFIDDFEQRFDKPQGITVFDDKVYVLDTTNNVYIFDTSGKYLNQISVGNSFSPTGPLGQGIAVDKDFLYVTDYFESRVKIFDHSGVLKKTIGEGSGEYFVTEQIATTIDTPPYVVYNSFQTVNEELSTFYNPEGISVEDGLIYVTDSLNSRVQVFDQSGEFVHEITTKASGASMSPYSYPFSESIEVRNGNVYVGDSSSNRIQIFDLQGEFEKQITSEGTGIVLEQPKDMVIYNDQIFTIDSANEELIQVINMDGSFVDRFGKSARSVGFMIITWQFMMT